MKTPYLLLYITFVHVIYVCVYTDIRVREQRKPVFSSPSTMYAITRGQLNT